MDKEAENAIVELSQGNPLAVKALSVIFYEHEKDFAEVVSGLRVLEISGEKLAITYGSYCSHDAEKFIKAITERDPGIKEHLKSWY